MQDRSPHFRTTRWSLVLRAGSAREPRRTAALEELCAAYWYPLYAYARRRGRAPSDAEDDVQALFAHLLEKRALGALDAGRGRFRGFLLTAFRNHMADRAARERATKRGAGVRPLPFDAQDAEARYALEPVELATPEALFTRAWALDLLRDVLGELRDSYAARGQQQLFDALKGALTGEQPSFAALARELDASEGSLRVAAHRLRGRYRRALEEHISDTLYNPAEAEAELRDLFRALRAL